jgi:uncharacterized protein (DUF2237 family)
MPISPAKNVLGGPLETCSLAPLTGFFRDGCCNTNEQDQGLHVVCIRTTAEFLQFSKRAGNDLSTPQPTFGFPGLKPNDRWCLCAARWKEALDAGCPPPVFLAGTHEAVLKIVAFEDLERHALDRLS